MLRPSWAHVGTIFRSWAPFAALAVFVAFRGRFVDAVARSRLDFERSRDSGESFGSSGPLFFKVCTRVRAYNVQMLEM